MREPPETSRHQFAALLVALGAVAAATPAAAQPSPAPPPAVPRAGPSFEVKGEPSKTVQNLAALKKLLPDQMNRAKLTDGERAQVTTLLGALQAIIDKQPVDATEAEAQIREYLARGGELRDLLDDLRLPDPGDLLPPGPRSRLGIVFVGEERTGRALVKQVLPQYRADKMGMLPGDRILTLNGSKVTAEDLVQAVVKASRPYVIEVLRNGAKVLLHEPAPR